MAAGGSTMHLLEIFRPKEARGASASSRMNTAAATAPKRPGYRRTSSASGRRGDAAGSAAAWWAAKRIVSGRVRRQAASRSRGAEADEREAAPAPGQDLDPHKQEGREPGAAGLNRAYRRQSPTRARRGSNSSAITTTAGSVSATAKVRAQNCRRTNTWAVGRRRSPREERVGENGPEQHFAATDPIGHQGDNAGRGTRPSAPASPGPKGRLWNRQVGLDLLQGEGKEIEVVHFKNEAIATSPSTRHWPREGGAAEKGGQPHPGGPRGPVAVGGQAVAGCVCLF